jgi:GNAT superfamily N-acetyltransferase
VNEITFVDMNYLQSLMRMPHFMVLGLYRNAILIGEVIMAGQGSDCELAAIYIEPGSRNQGMGRALLHRMMAIMAAEGVTRITTRIMSRSLPQQRLMDDFGGSVIGVNMIFPGMYLN